MERILTLKVEIGKFFSINEQIRMVAQKPRCISAM